MKILPPIFILFAIVAIGYICKRLRVISNDMNRDVGNLLIYISTPSLILISLSSFDLSKEMLTESVSLLAISFSVYLFYILMSYIFPKLLRAKGTTKDILQFATVFGNAGFIGLPVAHAVFGAKGVFYMALFDVFFYLFVWTFGVMVLSRPQKDKKAEKKETQGAVLLKLIINPNIIAVCLGFVLFLTSLKLPNPIEQTLNLLGSMTTPLAMIFIGSTLADMEFARSIKDLKVILCSIERLILKPLLILVVLKLLNFNGYLLAIPVLYTAMPVAAITPILAAKYGNDYFLATRILFVSTILSVATLPCIIWIIG